MSKIIVRNNTSNPLGLPGGLLVPANGELPVDAIVWDERIRPNRIVQAWLKRKILSELQPNQVVIPDSGVDPGEDDSAEDSGGPVADDESDLKDHLISQIADYGVKASRRMSLKTLQERLSELQGE